MKTEIERKFLSREIPNLKYLEKVVEERFYLPTQQGIELRAQRKGDKYSIVKKYLVSEFERNSDFTEISEQKYLELKSEAKNIIERVSYSYSINPKIDIKVYSGQHDGLIRIEVEFENAEQMKAYKAPDWFGKEITGTKLARDSDLVDLSDIEFKKLIGN